MPAPVPQVPHEAAAPAGAARPQLEAWVGLEGQAVVIALQPLLHGRTLKEAGKERHLRVPGSMQLDTHVCDPGSNVPADSLKSCRTQRLRVSPWLRCSQCKAMAYYMSCLALHAWQETNAYATWSGAKAGSAKPFKCLTAK